MMQAIEITATILGLIQGVLVMLNRRINWVFYCLQMIALLFFSWNVGLYGDVVNDVIYLFLGLCAYHLWGKGTTRCISLSSVRAVVAYSMVTIVSTVLLYFYLASTNDPLPLLDAISTTTSFLATILMVFRRLDCWIIWLINDLLYCVEYYMLPNQAIYLLILNAVWCIMAIVSFITWRKRLHTKPFE